MKLAAEPGEDSQAQALDAVAAYTQTFNKMGFIETEERDEIYTWPCVGRFWMHCRTTHSKKMP